MEKDTNKAILVVGISNPNRLNAHETEDFFLVENKDYKKAVRVLKTLEESDDPKDVIETTSGAMVILTANGIDFEHIMEGRRFFFNSMVVEDSECDCND